MVVNSASHPALPPLPFVGFCLRRYLPMEICGWLSALLCSGLATTLTGNTAVIAVVGAWSASAGYYGWALAACLRQHAGLGAALRALALEFGPAEILDVGLVRPALVMAGLQLIGNTQLGLVSGGLAADAVFYAIVIALRPRLPPHRARHSREGGNPDSRPQGQSRAALDSRLRGNDNRKT